MVQILTPPPHTSTHLVVTVAALTSQTTRDVHTAEERLLWRVAAQCDVAELTLYRRVVALVDDVKQTVALR